MSVCFLEANVEEELYLKKTLTGTDLQFSALPPVNLNGFEEPEDVTVLSPFVHSYVGVGVLDQLPNLKLIATRSTGFDHIDVASANKRGILVSNVPTYGENTVAEHTFALILALSRNIHKASTRTFSGDFSLDGLQGFDLFGKTLGIIGTGHIGLFVARIAHGFGMKVLAADPAPNAEAAELLSFNYVDLPHLLNESDVVTLHAPLSVATYHIIGHHNIGQFKRGALLINTARGGLVDTDALLSALDQKILAGAGLDVIEGEEIFSEEKQLLGNPNATNESLKTALRNLSLLRRPDLVITPHIGFDSREAVRRILDTTTANINGFLSGAPQNLIGRSTATINS